MSTDLPHCRYSWTYHLRLLLIAAILFTAGRAGATCSAAWTYTIHGDTVFLHSNDTSSANHHYWSYNGTYNTADHTSLTLVFPNYGTQHICQYVYTNGGGCSDSSCANITLQPPANCTLTAGWQYYMHGDTAYFFAGNTNTAAHYFWNFGDGSPIASGPTLTHVYANAGTYHVCLYDYIPNTACADSFCQTVSVTAQQCHVSAAFTYTIHGDTVFLHSTDTLSANHHLWTINGVYNTADHVNLTQVFPNYGTYRICLHVYTPGITCIDSSCTSITLTAPCHYSAAWTYTASGDTVHFRAADTAAAAHRYWTFGDGATATTIDPVHVYTAPGTYHVCLRAYIPGTSCVDSFCSTIIVAGCNVHAGWQYYMRGDTAHFFAGTNVTGVSYYWSYGDGSTGSGATPLHVYAHAGTYHVCLYAYNSTSCRDSFCNTVTVGTGCHVSAAWTYTVQGDTVVLHSADTLHANNHYWTFGTGSAYVSGTTVTHVFSGQGTYSICLHVYTPGTTCYDSSCNTVTIANTCNVHAAWQYYTVHDSVHFYNFSNDSTVHLDWRFGDGQYGFGTNPWHGYAHPGTYQVCCFAYTNGCIDSFCAQITVGAGCHVSAAWSYIVHGDTVFLHSTDTLSANNHYWTFGTPNYTSGTSVTHVFNGPGTYHICLHVYTPGTTCSDSSCNSITIANTNCVANAAWTSVTTGSSVAFHAADTFSAVSMDWNLGDGTWAFGQNPVHTYTQPGTYHVCCYAYTSNTCVDSFCNTIVIGSGCHVSALWTYTVHGDTVYFTAVDTASANHHYWIFGGNTASYVSGTTAAHIYTGPGTYHVCLYVYTPGTQCADSSCNNITIANPCNVHAAWQSYSVGDTAHFFAAGNTNNVSYYWSFGDGTTGSGATPLHVYLHPGTYHVCLYAYNSTNCRDSFCNTITIAGGCHVTSAWTYASYGDSVHITGLDSNTLAHRYWTFGDGTSGTGHDIYHVYHAPGVYTVCSYIYIPGSACMDSSCNTVIVTGTCSVAAAMNYINVSHDTVAFYSLFRDSAANYIWIYGDGTTGSGAYSIHGYPVPGTYHICLRVFIPGTPCADSVCLDVNIGANCAVTAAWASIPRGSDSLQFYAADPDTAAAHSWSFGDGTTASGSYAAHTYAAPGTYHVCLYVAVPGTTCADSLCRDITSALGIESAGSAAATITLRPNPMSQYAILSIDGPAATYEVRIYDMIGQQLRTLVGVNNTIMIDRGSLSAGIYTYAVLAGGHMIGQGKLSVE